MDCRKSGCRTRGSPSTSCRSRKDGGEGSGMVTGSPGQPGLDRGTRDLEMVKTEQQFIKRGSRLETEHPVLQPLRK